MTNRKLKFQPLPGRYAVCRLPADAPIPAWADCHPFTSVTRTDRELSIVVPEDRVPPGVHAESDWTAFRIAGVLDFTEIGLMSAVARIFADAAIPVFALSTFETDYFFVPSRSLGDAIDAIVAAGHTLVHP